MIYNLKRTDIEFGDELEANKVKALLADKSAKDRKYFIVTLANSDLVDHEKRYQHPSPDDVFIHADDAYGLDVVIKSSRNGKVWEFNLLVHKLVKQKYAATKEFGVDLKAG